MGRRRRERELRLEQNALERRENDEWKAGETGTVGIMANALMEWLIGEGEFEDKWEQNSRYREPNRGYESGDGE